MWPRGRPLGPFPRLHQESGGAEARSEAGEARVGGEEV